MGVRENRCVAAQLLLPCFPGVEAECLPVGDLIVYRLLAPSEALSIGRKESQVLGLEGQLAWSLLEQVP